MKMEKKQKEKSKKEAEVPFCPSPATTDRLSFHFFEAIGLLEQLFQSHWLFGTILLEDSL